MAFYRLNESSAALRRIPVALVSADVSLTPLIGVAITSSQAFLSKNGGTLTTVLGTFVSVANGSGEYYYIASASELDTPGYLLLRVSVTGALPFRGLHEVHAVDMNASANLGMSMIPTTVVGGTDQWSVTIGDNYPEGTAGNILAERARVMLRGYVSTGGSKSFILPSGFVSQNGFYNDQQVFFVSGTGAPQAAIIENYAGGTGTVSLATTLAVAVVTGTEFEIRPFGIRGLSRQEVASAVWEVSIQSAITSTAGWYVHRLDTSVGTRHASGATLVASSVIDKTGFTVSLAASAFTSAVWAADGLTRLVSQVVASVWNESGRSVTSVTDKAGYTVSIATSAIKNSSFVVSTFTERLFDASAVDRFADHFIKRELSAARASEWGNQLGTRSPLWAYAKLANRLRNAVSLLEVYQEDDSTLFFTQTITTSVSAAPIIEVDTN